MKKYISTNPQTKAAANDNASRNVVSFGQHKVLRELPRHLRAWGL